MKKWVECELEWAYYIDPINLGMRKVRGKVPIGSVLLAKIRVTRPRGGSKVLTEYILAEQFGLRAITSKEEAGEHLSRQMVTYMRNNQEMPPRVEVIKTYSNGDVDLQYRPSNYDVFIVSIKRRVLGMNPRRFIGQLETNRVATSA